MEIDSDPENNNTYHINNLKEDDVASLNQDRVP